MGSRVPAAASLLLTVSLILAVFSGRTHADGQISVYWGQNGFEGSLREACETGFYNYVILAFMHVFGNFQTPQINLAGHCNPYVGECVSLSDQIEWCQQNGVKVFLSLGGGAGYYFLTSEEDARQLAEYIWNNFLSGSASSSRPLGNAVLDGVDFDIEGGGMYEHYDNLARFLKKYDDPEGRRVYLSAAPQCPYPDYYMQQAIDTGLFDYLWIQFYKNYCQYSNGNSATLVSVWEQWQKVPVNHTFLGLPASTAAAGSGYVSPAEFCSDILPKITTSPKFSGIMLWSRYYDKLNNFTPQVLYCLENSVSMVV